MTDTKPTPEQEHWAREAATCIVDDAYKGPDWIPLITSIIAIRLSEREKGRGADEEAREGLRAMLQERDELLQGALAWVIRSAKARGMSLGQIGDLCQVAASTVDRWEKQEVHPHPLMTRALIRALISQPASPAPTEAGEGRWMKRVVQIHEIVPPTGPHDFTDEYKVKLFDRVRRRLYGDPNSVDALEVSETAARITELEGALREAHSAANYGVNSPAEALADVFNITRAALSAAEAEEKKL